MWVLFGPSQHYSDAWQMVVNTGTTTIITFLMTFFIANAQNRDTIALYRKLDALIANSRAHNRFIGIEDLHDELDALKHLGVRPA